MKSFHDAAARLGDWLQRNFDADGLCAIDPEDSRYYYKTPYLMTMAGMRSRGGRVARQIMEKFVAGDGELQSAAAPANRVYAMGWIALGAAAAERFDLAHLMADRLEHLQDARCGGIVLADEDAGEEVAEVCFSGGAGMALAAVGRLQSARLMCDTFRALIDEQERAPCFYNRFRRDGSVLARKAGGDWEMAYDMGEEEQRAATWTWSTATAPIPPISADRPSSAGPC